MDFEIKKVWNRYGLTEDEWANLSPADREIQYDRWRKIEGRCNHPYKYGGGSFDPYLQTAHMDKCQRPAVSIEKCPCQMCVNRIGISREVTHG